MKRKSILIVIILSIIVLTGCSNKNQDSDALKFKNDYESLNGVETTEKGVYYRSINIDEDNPIVYTTFKDVKEKIENDDSFILYVGFAACPWCRTVIPYIIKSAKENNINKIYYINIREDNTKQSDLRGYYKLDKNNKVIYDVYPDKYYHDVLDTLDDFLTPYTLTNGDKEVKTGENRLYAPTLVAYKDGEAIALDECLSDNQKDGYQELTDEIIDDMTEKANKLFEKYKND